MPIVPIRGTVVFPSVPVNLEITSSKTASVIGNLNDDDNMIFIVAQRDVDSEWSGNAKDLYSIGTVSKINKITRNSDGSMNLLAEGICRGELTGITKASLYYADVICRNFEYDSSSLKIQALVGEVLALFEQYIKNLPNIAKDIEKHVRTCSNPAKLADIIAATLLLKFDDKQDILEEYEPVRRLELLIFKMQKELELFSQELEIHKKVRARIDDNQREYYMREQLKVLKEELGEDSDDSEFHQYANRIIEANFPEEIEAKLIKEAEKLDRLPYGAAERTVLLGYLDVCLTVPFGKKSDGKIDTVFAKKILNKDHYGLDEIKERILEYLSVMKLTEKTGSQIICLVGAPGVGKTSVASSIARALDKPFVRVSLGGVRDEADIRGHRKTYIGAMPGRIINAVIEAKSRNPVILLDEIDKLTRDSHGDPASALLEVLDPDQNKNFRDHFVEMPIDLSDCLFICTANTLSTIPKPLLDRMEVIELHSYTREEKLEIAKKYLVPREIKNHGLTKKIISISDAALYEVIDRYTFEAGVRNLERAIAKICRKAARMYVEEEQTLFKIKPADIYYYLGARKYDPEVLDKEDRIGIVNGLAYTDNGGELLKVEALALSGSGKTELTGSLGEVMKESARIAVSLVRERAEGLGIDTEFYKNKDIHVHFPEGAVPKDGPSAGVALTTVLVSALGKYKVRRDVAMTGEITLTGRVLAIGGLREKVTAAKKSGIKKVLIPYDNRQDLEKLEPYVKEGLEFVLCRRIDDVLMNAVIYEDKHDFINGSDYAYLEREDKKRSKGETKYNTNNA